MVRAKQLLALANLLDLVPHVLDLCWADAVLLGLEQDPVQYL